ncbi:MAG: nucleotidyltransferase domain-containing protein [Desulfotomaculales bacterium]
MRGDLMDVEQCLSEVERLVGACEGRAGNRARNRDRRSRPAAGDVELGGEISGGEVNFEEKRYSLSAGEKEQITAHLKEFLEKRPEICFAFLHGSFLDDLSSRDLDLGVYFDPALAPDAIFDLVLELSFELTALLGLPVDVHALNRAGSGFCYHVTRGLLLVSRDDQLAYDFMERTWLDYLDF